MPVDGDENAYGRFEQACSVEQSYFAAAAETLGTELVIKQYVYIYRLPRTGYSASSEASKIDCG